MRKRENEFKVRLLAKIMSSTKINPAIRNRLISKISLKHLMDPAKDLILIILKAQGKV